MKLISIFLLIIISSLALAHVDTKLVPSDEGVIYDLPPEYSPASFDSEALKLTIGGRTLKFPPCVAKYFGAPNSKIDIAASWYHDSYALPPYIFFDIYPPKMGFKYHLLFNLNTLMPIEFRIDAELKKNETYMHELVIDDECQVSISEAMQSGK
ncbi:hypothetical protein [Microbulbifer hainanensis]|uniref:hypothetical protein n=1 Tax=Microbulbifer hainanensis TaxID=2735675 RepID=UPI0018685B61|nr:hypothetical protein [Microbulbifer hainanensis]